MNNRPRVDSSPDGDWKPGGDCVGAGDEHCGDRARAAGLRPSESIVAVAERVRAAQGEWMRRPFAERLRIIGRLAACIAAEARPLAAASSRPMASTGEILASEVLPLAEACRYVARRGHRVLSPHRLPGRDGAWWMGSIGVREIREPYGVVLIIGPANYPLLLPGVQLVQALAAGNGVIVKAAPGCAAPLEQLLELCGRAGVPDGLACLVATSPQAAQETIRAGVDKVLFTGSRATGLAVARTLAETLTPAALELSGNDAVFVLDGADLNRVASAVAYGLALNGGQTCIAPRRLFATRQTLDALRPRLEAALDDYPPCPLPSHALAVAQAAIRQALAEGAELVSGTLPDRASEALGGEASDAGRSAPLAPGSAGLEPAAPLPTMQPTMRPVVLRGVGPSMAVARQDLFAPVLSLIEVEHMDAAIALSRQCRYALGASVFGPTRSALRLAERVAAGCVTVNDVVVPTADPRVSFGGWNSSGYGVTRGLEGLRELSRLKVVSARRGRWLPHLSADRAGLATLMESLLLLRHGGGLRSRWHGFKLLITHVFGR